MPCRIIIIIAAAFAAIVPAHAESGTAGLEQRVRATLAEAGPGVRFGLVVTTEDGRELIAIRPDDRFIPASNTKMFSTALAFATMTGLTLADEAGGAAVALVGHDVVLTGHGDARLSSAADCIVDCLKELADAVATKTRRVRDVIGDDRLFPDERWGPGMSWNNIQTRSGAAASALSLDDNELAILVSPGAPGAAPMIAMPLAYYGIENQAVTTAGGETRLDLERAPNGMTARLTGTIATTASPQTLRMGIDDPAHYAAWRLKTLLEARGVTVTGTIRAHHRPLMPADDPERRAGTPASARPAEPTPIARLVPPPLADDLTLINKVSQNLHAELILRRAGLKQGSGSIADGLAKLRAMLARAGVPRTTYNFYDGSGMSSYNRVAPRGMAIFLRWIAAQPWGAAWRATLPIAGVDGTLTRRFKGTALEGRFAAKTGTLNASNALSGYMTAKSGRTLIVSAFANDVPEDVDATAAMDKALVLVAEGL